MFLLERQQRALSDVYVDDDAVSAVIRLADVQFRKLIDTNGQERMLASTYTTVRPTQIVAPKIMDTRSLQAYLGHASIMHTVRYTEMSPTRFKGIWR